MRLIVIDDDSHYLRAVQSVISMTTIGQSSFSNLEFYGLTTIESLNTLDRTILGSGVICVPIRMIKEMTDWFDKCIQMNDSRGDIVSDIRPLILFHCDGSFSTRSVEIVKETNYWKKIFEDTNIMSECRKDVVEIQVTDLFINKFQKVTDWLKAVKSSYVHLMPQEVVQERKETRLISIFAPMVRSNQSQELIDKLSLCSPNRRRLVLFFDPYYGYETQNENYRTSLSYFFSLMKRKSNMNFLAKHMCCKIGEDLDVIYGPMNMKDLDSLSLAQTQDFVRWLEHYSGYEEIILHFSGIHINGIVDKLLKISKERILISLEEKVQETITQQYKMPWILGDRQGYGVISEVLT